MRKANKIAALSFAAMLSAVSCINTDKTLGVDFVPTNQDISIKTAEFDLPVGQRLSDSLQSTLSQAIVVGSINGGEFGKVQVGSALSLTPSKDSIDWGGNPVFKEMYVDVIKDTLVTLKDDQKFIPQNIYVNFLNKEIDSTMIYNNSIKPEHISTRSATKGSTVYMGSDTLRFYFSRELGEELFRMTREELDSTELFVKKFYGLYFSTDEVDGESGSGRISKFSTGSSYAAIKYTSTNAAGIRRDTTAYFVLGTYGNTMSIKCGNNAMESEDAADEILYEGYCGIKPYISGIKLRTMLEEWMKSEDINPSQIIISKATFEFPFEYDGDYDKLDRMPKNMYLINRLHNGDYSIYTPLSEIYISSYDKGDINRSLMYYRPDAGLYLQALLKKDVKDVTDEDDLWIIPTISYTEDDSSSSSYYNPYSYYDPYGYGSYGYSPYGYGSYGYGGMYGGMYGYSPYGYGGYGYSPYGYGGYGYDPFGYGYGYGYGYGSSSSSSGETYYYTDYLYYNQCKLNGTKAERHPKLRITYTVLK